MSWLECRKDSQGCSHREVMKEIESYGLILFECFTEELMALST